MGLLDGKVAIVTGAGRGIGRDHSLLLAREGARIIVNDLGGSAAGEGTDQTPAEQVVKEIEAMGGEAAVNYANVADFKACGEMVQQAVDTFGQLDILVNNAGILRDKMIFNMSEEEWDAVIAVHLKGTFNPTRHAAAYWREKSKAGEPVAGRVISTSSPSGIYGNVGQANYGAAKAAIAAFTVIIAQELSRYGVTANAIAPTARTRLTELTFGAIPKPDAGFDRMDPANISPLIAYLASDDAAGINGQVFAVTGGTIQLVQGWTPIRTINKDARWEPAELVDAIEELVPGKKIQPEGMRRGAGAQAPKKE
ncbi:MAG: SDR family oxidoreductase [Acidimicrobiia bacterium]